MALAHLLRTRDLTADDLAALLELSAAFKADPHLHPDTLRDETVVMYFNKPSTRTRLSTATAVARLGGVALSVDGSTLQLGRGETIEDTARVIARYAKAFVIRTYADADVRRFAAASTIPVVNALTDGHHPCQSVADLLTLQEHKGDLRQIRVAYVGDGNNVTHSLMEAMALAGGHLRVATPPGYEPDPTITAGARALAAAHGGTLEVGHDAVAAVRDVDAVYTDTWMSMNTPAEEKEQRLAVFAPYRVDDTLLSHADPGAIALHCLPAHRGEEITDAVMDGPRSAVFDQAENRLHTAAAILHALVRGTLVGAP